MDSEKRRLILVKGLYEHGRKHADYGTTLDRIIAIHNLDNSIEWLLKSVALKIGIEIYDKKSKQYLSFYRLWKEVNDKIKDKKLPLKDEIFGLHDLRNKAQHHANIPSQEDTQRYLICTKEFINQLLKDIFDGIEYDELYLSLLIENEDLKAKIMDAEKAFEKKQYLNSINLCINALTDAAWGNKTIALSAGRLTSFFGAGKELKNVISEEYIKKTYPDNKLAKEIGKAILQMGQSSTCMQFLTLPQKLLFLKVFDTTNKQKISKKDAQDSINFVVDVILNWEEMRLIKKVT